MSVPSEVVDTILRVAADTFPKAGLPFSPSRVSKKVRAGFRARGVEGAVAEVRSLYVQLAGEARGSDLNRVYLRALSLECRENPYVAKWLAPVSGGLPE